MPRGLKYNLVRSKRRYKILKMLRIIKDKMLSGSSCKVSADGINFWSVSLKS